MTVKDVMTLLESPDRVRVIKDGEEIYNQYFANMEVDKDIVAQIGDAEVKRFRAIPEITHRKYKERGLIAPMKPEETPDYSFRDLQMCLYLTITIYFFRNAYSSSKRTLLIALQIKVTCSKSVEDTLTILMFPANKDEVKDTAKFTGTLDGAI